MDHNSITKAALYSELQAMWERLDPKSAADRIREQITFFMPTQRITEPKEELLRKRIEFIGQISLMAVRELTEENWETSANAMAWAFSRCVDFPNNDRQLLQRIITSRCAGLGFHLNPVIAERFSGLAADLTLAAASFYETAFPTQNVKVCAARPASPPPGAPAIRPAATSSL